VTAALQQVSGHGSAHSLERHDSRVSAHSVEGKGSGVDVQPVASSSSKNNASEAPTENWNRSALRSVSLLYKLNMNTVLTDLWKLQK
jgi:hypothetical protein